MSAIAEFLESIEDYESVDEALRACGHVLEDSELAPLYNDYKYHRDLIVNRLIDIANERMVSVEGLN